MNPGIQIFASEPHAVKGRKFAVSSFKKNLTFHMARAEVGGSDAEVDMLFGDKNKRGPSVGKTRRRIYTVVFTALYALAGWGLWKLKNWGVSCPIAR
jgi:hypothetical protein